MWHHFKIAYIGFIFIGLSYGSYLFSTGSLYIEYQNLFEYRRLSPDFLPNTRAIKILDAGHATTYADTIWIGLIQYIGDNIGNGKYRNFTNPLVARINELHPYFASTYNLALVLSPSLDSDKPDYEKKQAIAREALILGEKGMKILCNQSKWELIAKRDFGKSLWEDQSISEPCSDSMIAYNVANVAGTLSELKKAELYYKIASTHKNAPQASRFLGPLMQAKE